MAENTKSYVAYTKADMFYRIMYFDIIQPLYKALEEENVKKAHQMVKLLLINNISFFANHKEKCKNIKTALAKIRRLLPNTTGATTQQQHKIQIETKIKCLEALENILEDIYDIMEHYKMRVWSVKENDEPIAASLYRR